jgi:hypothetical protein
MVYPYVSLPELPPGYFYVFDFNFESKRMDKESYLDLDIRADPTEKYQGGQLVAYFPLHRDGPDTRGEARETEQIAGGWQWRPVMYDSRDDAIAATVAKLWVGELVPLE